MKEAEEKLDEVYDIIFDAMDPDLMGMLSVVGHDPLQQIKRIIDVGWMKDDESLGN